MAKNAYWGAYGKTLCNPVLPKSVKSILFICLGNICRSPFAEKYASMNYKNTCGYNFSSAGIQGEFPRSSPVEAREAARFYGIDLSGFLSRKFDNTMAEHYDLIFVMDVWQFNYMVRTHHAIRNKVFLLPLYEKYPLAVIDKYTIYNIKDPYGKSLSDFSECYQRIVTCLSEFMKEIRH